jgi:hypothetical protein
MNENIISSLASWTAAILIGAYLGVFISEGITIYECEKDKAVTIKGAFWKGEIKYSCVRGKS